ncbi:MAG: F0F1 ATP synthase subunit B [Mycobacteriales bacterium]
MLAAALMRAAEEGKQDNVLIPHLDELILGLIAFGVLYYFVGRKLLPRAEKLYEERRDRIEGGLARAEQAQLEAQRTLAAYRAQLAEARHEANKIREDARVQGKAILEEMRVAAQEEAARITARGEEQLQSERAATVASLRTEIGRLSVDLAGRILGERLEEDARQRELINRFLDDIETNGATPRTGSRPASASDESAKEPVR